MATGVGTAFLCLYFTVVSTLFSRDSLRHQTAGHERWAGCGEAGGSVDCYWSDWFVRGGVGGDGLIGKSYAGMTVPWVGLMGLFLAITAYAVRDGMFLQWMVSQRVKLPVLKGAVLLVCYYVGSGVLAATLVGPERMGQMLRWLTPVSGDPTHLADVSVVLVVAMLVPPLATAGLLAGGVFRKMQRSSASAARPVNA